MARGLAQRQAIACGTVKGLGRCFLHSSHSEIWAGSLKLLLAIGAYALINVKEKVHMRLFLKSSEVPCPALSRGGYQAAGTQLLDRSHLWRFDPHDWHWRAPEFRHFPEANCCRPRRWARGMVFRQRIGA